MNKKTYLFSNLLAWGILALLISNYVFGWSTPSSNPPDGNVVLPWTVSGSDVYYNGDGNVGIGTENPVAKLDIYDSGSDTVYNSERGIIRMVNSADTNEKFYLTYDNNLGTYGSAVIQAVKSGVVWLPLLLNPNGGNVGIGTTNPGAKLEVNGNIIADNPTADNHVATKEYVDDSSGGGYTNCYINCARSNIDCNTGYTAVLTSKGTGCTTVPDWTFVPGAGFFRIVTCQAYSTGGYRECLQVGGGNATINNYCDGCSLSVLCKYPYDGKASTCQVCCK